MITINTTKPASAHKTADKAERKPSKSKLKLEGLVTKAKAIQARLDAANLEYPIHLNLKTGNMYKGENMFILEAEKAEQGYSSNSWVGFHQILEMGGCVKKGAKGCPIKVYKTYSVEKEDGTEEGKSFFSVFCVFNLDAVELEAKEEAGEVA